MKNKNRIMIAAAIAVAFSIGISGCGKKIYLEQPKPQPGEEKPINPRVGETERREPYVIDQRVDELEQDYILEEVPPSRQ